MELKCADLMEGCQYKAVGSNEEEVLNKMWQHHQSAHPEDIEGEDEEEMKNEWRQHIQK